MDDQEVKLPVLKASTAWLTVFLSSLWQSFSNVPWDILAQFAAFIYTAVLLAEWLWKKIRRPRGTN